MNNWRQNLQIIKQLTITDFKLRYSGSVLGYLWSLLKPLGLFLVLYLVFARMLKFGSSIPNYPTYLLIGIMLWYFFSEVTANGLQAVVVKGYLIKKIYFPRIIVVLVSSFNSLINLLLNLLVLTCFMVYFQIDVFHAQTFLIFFYIFELWLLGLGLSLFLSALYVQYRDLQYIWELFLQAFFYLTPIIYPINMVAEKYWPYMAINPVSQIITDFRSTFIIFDFPHFAWQPWAQIIVVLFVFFGGLIFFQSRQKYFAEEL